MENQIEQTPWGNIKILENGPNFVVKKLTINPNSRLSYQSHEKRKEHWYILSGEGSVILNDKPRTISEGDSIDVPKSMKHRVGSQNTGMIVIEVSVGEISDEDIVRYEDDYGRETK